MVTTYPPSGRAETAASGLAGALPVPSLPALVAAGPHRLHLGDPRRADAHVDVLAGIGTRSRRVRHLVAVPGVGCRVAHLRRRPHRDAGCAPSDLALRLCDDPVRLRLQPARGPRFPSGGGTRWILDRDRVDRSPRDRLVLLGIHESRGTTAAGRSVAESVHRGHDRSPPGSDSRFPWIPGRAPDGPIRFHEWVGVPPSRSLLRSWSWR